MYKRQIETAKKNLKPVTTTPVDPDNPTDPDNPGTADSSMMIFVSLALVSMAAAAFVVAKKKKA